MSALQHNTILSQNSYDVSKFAKITLDTSVGPLDVELWCNEFPEACRMFLQLCMDGHLDRSQFYKLSYNQYIEISLSKNYEINPKNIISHQNAKMYFSQRGILGFFVDEFNECENSLNIIPFFTLGPIPKFNNRHQILGKIVGNTIYNLLKINDFDTNQNDEILRKCYIERVSIIDKYFNDFIISPKKENLNSNIISSDMIIKDVEIKSKNKRKNQKMLTFDCEEDDVNQNRFESTIKSLHNSNLDPKFISDSPKLIVSEIIKKQINEIKENQHQVSLKKLNENPKIEDNSTKKNLAKQIRELQGDIFDLMHPDDENDEYSKLKMSRDSLDWYRSMIEKYNTCKRSIKLSKSNEKMKSNNKNEIGHKNCTYKSKRSSLIDSIETYKLWLEKQKNKIREINKMDEIDQPLVKHWLSNQLCDEDNNNNNNNNNNRNNEFEKQSSLNNEKIEKARDISIFDVQRYDISDPRNIINVRRREGSN